MNKHKDAYQTNGLPFQGFFIMFYTIKFQRSDDINKQWLHWSWYFCPDLQQVVIQPQHSSFSFCAQPRTESKWLDNKYHGNKKKTPWNPIKNQFGEKRRKARLSVVKIEFTGILQQDHLNTKYYDIFYIFLLLLYMPLVCIWGLFLLSLTIYQSYQVITNLLFWNLFQVVLFLVSSFLLDLTLWIILSQHCYASTFKPYSLVP